MRRQSLSGQLTRMTVVATLGVLGFTSIALFVFEVNEYRDEAAQSLLSTARVIAENASGVLLFDDRPMAEQMLAALRSEHSVTAAGLYDQSGHLFASFKSAEGTPAPVPAVLTKPDGTRRSMAGVVVQIPVTQGGLRVGTVYIRGTWSGAYERLRVYGSVLLGVGAAALLLGVFVARMMQKRISAPVQALARAARSITDARDFSVRAPEPVASEFADLTQAFNAMLDEVQRRSTALSESEERFRTLADNIGQLAWITTADGSIIWYNRRWYEYTGTTPEQVAGWGWQSVHHPDHVDRVTARFKTAIAEGENWEDTFPLRGRDGNFRWFLSRAFAIRNEAGEIVRWFGTNTDVTDQRLAQERVEAHARRAELLSRVATQLFVANSSTEAFVALLPAISAAVHARHYAFYLATGDGRLELASRSEGMSTPASPCDALLARVAAECVRRQTSLTFTTLAESAEPIVLACGQAGARACASFLLRSVGEVLGAVVFAADTEEMLGEAEQQFLKTVCDVCASAVERSRLLTDLRSARDVAERANAAKDEFLAALSHELRTPLNPVLLLASDAAVDASLSEDVRQRFAQVAKNVAVETQLIDDLLDVTKIARGKLALDCRPVDPHVVLRDAIALVEPEARAKRLTLHVELETGAHRIVADSVRIQQVFWNILKNAVRFSAEGGQIDILSRSVAAARGGLLEVEFRDVGIGMTADELGRVFNAFVQGDHAQQGAHQFGGLGLGLAISRSLVELHGGTVTAESPGRGRGSIFRVRLPLAAASAETPTDLRAGPERSAVKASRILMVEDHAPTRVALAALLARRGHMVAAASCSVEAKQLAAEQPFDLVISDIGLPDESGYDLMTHLRATAGLRGVAVSGYGMAADVAKAKAAGFAAHLTKPVSMQALDAVLRDLLSSPAASVKKG